MHFIKPLAPAAGKAQFWLSRIEGGLFYMLDFVLFGLLTVLKFLLL